MAPSQVARTDSHDDQCHGRRSDDQQERDAGCLAPACSRSACDYIDETPEHPALDTTRFILVHFQLLALLALASLQISIYRTVIIIGTVDSGENPCSPRSAIVFCPQDMCGVRGRHDPCCGRQLARPGLALVAARLPECLPQCCPQTECTAKRPPSQPVGGLLLDAVGQLGDLRIKRPACGHQGADFPVRIDDRGVVAALIMLMKSLVNSSELAYPTFRPDQVKDPKCLHNSMCRIRSAIATATAGEVITTAQMRQSRNVRTLVSNARSGSSPIGPP